GNREIEDSFRMGKGDSGRRQADAQESTRSIDGDGTNDGLDQGVVLSLDPDMSVDGSGAGRVEIDSTDRQRLDLLRGMEAEPGWIRADRGPQRPVGKFRIRSENGLLGVSEPVLIAVGIFGGNVWNDI